ncbi:uncharacterized protein PV09_06052 [Verruconis gallopava]|uniref:Uncharacterized protein n=1 Tax=Verruconis gallopava TaxID=253628 RepID=A0A0D2A789_9PEZI|nr:uncharacterized protein PV09_06052 [Verruconis gallopava]KIW02603.1 hypothetical protein PV09_06052 [Verruconis gallopava]
MHAAHYSRARSVRTKRRAHKGQADFGSRSDSLIGVPTRGARAVPEQSQSSSPSPATNCRASRQWCRPAAKSYLSIDSNEVGQSSNALEVGEGRPEKRGRGAERKRNKGREATRRERTTTKATGWAARHRTVAGQDNDELQRVQREGR